MNCATPTYPLGTEVNLAGGAAMQSNVSPAREMFPLAGGKISIEAKDKAASPPFRAEYPPVRNLELVPDGLRQAMEESWARGRFEAHDVEIFLINGAYIIEECLIFDDNLQMISNVSDEYTDEEIEIALVCILRQIETRKLPYLQSPAIMSKRRAVNNYGHFLIEMLPMAMIANKLIAHFDPTFLLHRVEPPMLDVTLRAFRLLGIPLDRLLIFGPLEPVHVEHLVVVRGLTRHGSYMSPLCVDYLAMLAEKVAPAEQKKLFVRRRPGWRRGRSLLNETELGHRLEALGFHAIEPGEMTLEQQISAFSGADQVVAVSGAALTNIAFCRPGTRVINVVPSHFPDTFFWFIATHRRLRYIELRGQSDTQEAFEPTADFRISDSDLRWLDGLLQDNPTNIGAQTIAYVHDIGDVRCEIGEWAGFPNSGRCIEGFSIEAPEVNGCIQYCAVLGRNRLSPWVADGHFCGSRHKGQPLYGLSVRLDVARADGSGCFCDATFVDGTRKEGVPAGELCMAESLAPLEAFRIVLERN